MKRLLLIVLPLLLIVGCSKPINEETLIEKGGLLYEVNGQKPYTGDVFELYKDGSRKNTGSLKGGRYNGLIISWYENGQLKYTGNYVDPIDYFDPEDYYYDEDGDGAPDWGCSSEANNLFDYNSYHHNGVPEKFEYCETWYLNWEQFQAAGQEPNGTMDSNVIPPDDTPPLVCPICPGN